MKLSRWFLAITGLGLLSPPTSASTVQFSTQQMCELADWVLIGTTQSVQYSIHQPTGFAMTTAQIAVDRVGNGSPPPIISLTVLGGVIDGERRVVGGEPILDVGSRHLFLLAKPADGPPMLIGGMDGAMRLHPNTPLPKNQDMIEQWEVYCGQ